MKKLCSLLLALGLLLGLSVPALAAPKAEANQAAWTLYHLGLFQGTDVDAQGFPVFSLDRIPTRAEGVTMLVRLLGKETAAQKGSWETPFSDVPDWAEAYVGYAYDQKLTEGVGDGRFAPDTPISATEYLTLVLRALGYASGEDFQWDQAWNLSDELGFTDGEYGPLTKKFDRGDVAWISCHALDAPRNVKSKQTLRQALEKDGIRSSADLCVWEETIQACQEDHLVLTIAPAHGSERVYSKFTVESAWINGQPCQIQQYSTPKTTTTQLKKLLTKEEREDIDEDTFAMIYLTYDEEKALAAATETVEMHGRTFPVLKLQMKSTGSMPGVSPVKEMAEIEYYILGYFGGKLL